MPANRHSVTQLYVGSVVVWKVFLGGTLPLSACGKAKGCNHWGIAVH
jgi:hypothetical protein